MVWGTEGGRGVPAQGAKMNMMKGVPRATRGVLTGLSPQAIPPHTAPTPGSRHQPFMTLLHPQGSMWGTKEPFSRGWTLGRATVSAQGYNVSGLSRTCCCQA